MFYQGRIQSSLDLAEGLRHLDDLLGRRIYGDREQEALVALRRRVDSCNVILSDKHIISSTILLARLLCKSLGKIRTKL